MKLSNIQQLKPKTFNQSDLHNKSLSTRALLIPHHRKSSAKSPQTAEWIWFSQTESVAPKPERPELSHTDGRLCAACGFKWIKRHRTNTKGRAPRAADDAPPGAPPRYTQPARHPQFSGSHAPLVKFFATNDDDDGLVGVCVCVHRQLNSPHTLTQTAESGDGGSVSVESDSCICKWAPNEESGLQTTRPDCAFWGEPEHVTPKVTSPRYLSRFKASLSAPVWELGDGWQQQMWLSPSFYAPPSSRKMLKKLFSLYGNGALLIKI